MKVTNRNFIPGICELSSDSDSEEDLISFRKKKVILLETSDSEIEMTEIHYGKHRINDVWRNIVECDLLDQQINSIGIRNNIVNRDVESYELPPNKLGKRKKVNRHKNGFRKRIKVDEYSIDFLCSSDENDIKIIEKPEFIDHKDFKHDPIVLDDDDDDDDNKDILEIRCNYQSLDSSSSSSDSSSSDDIEDQINKKKYIPPKPNLNPNLSWKKIVESNSELTKDDAFMIEFHSGRQKTAQKIANKLNEPKVDLIERCLFHLGLNKCKIFLEAVLEIEENGGMPTLDGSRRRTPGGVFLTLIKSDRSIDRETKKMIFREDEPNKQNESLWWKSLEILQFRNNCRTEMISDNITRLKEFKSYTFIDLDFFESIGDFEYRYIPIMSNFPYNDVNHPLQFSDDEFDEFDEDYNSDIYHRFPTKCKTQNQHRVKNDDFMRLTDNIEPFCTANL